MSEKRGRKPKGSKIVERKKAVGSGVIAGPAIRSGWGKHEHGGGEVSGARTPARIGGRN